MRFFLGWLLLGVTGTYMGALLGTLIGDSVFRQTFAPSERGLSLAPPVNGGLGLQVVYRY